MPDKESIGRFAPNIFVILFGLWIAYSGGSVLLLVLGILALPVNIYLERAKRRSIIAEEKIKKSQMKHE